MSLFLCAVYSRAHALMASLPLPPGASDSFQLDLKGVLYDATVLPLAGTALVVNIGPTSAKVWCDVWAECGKKCEHMRMHAGLLVGLQLLFMHTAEPVLCFPLPQPRRWRQSCMTL